MEGYESVLLVKPEVFVFNLPPRSSNRGYRAADWNLSEPAWTGRMRLVTKNDQCFLKLEDKASGELYAKCPIEAYPGVAIEAVGDSSRYFVLRIEDDNGRTAFIGMGFGDRSDSFDLNVALQDHFKWLKKEKQIQNEPNEPTLNLGFKEGETIKIDMKITRKEGVEGSSRIRSNVDGAGSGSFTLLPPPPSGKTPSTNSSPLISPKTDKPTTPIENRVSQSGSSQTNSNWVQFQ